MSSKESVRVLASVCDARAARASRRLAVGTLSRSRLLRDIPVSRHWIMVFYDQLSTSRDGLYEQAGLRDAENLIEG